MCVYMCNIFLLYFLPYLGTYLYKQKDSKFKFHGQNKILQTSLLLLVYYNINDREKCSLFSKATTGQ